jgi:plastocyanin
MSTKTRGARVALAVAAVALVPTGAFAGASASSTHTVTLKNTAFHPGTLSIRRGESVKWVWEDGETEHNVTFRGMHSKTQAHGSYTIRFQKRGTFSYDCTIHIAEGMKGKIVVH